MAIIEKKRVPKSDEAAIRLAGLFNAPGQLGWSDIWFLTRVREFTDDAEKARHWVVQIAYVVRDQFGRVGVYRRAAKGPKGARFSPGKSVLAGASLLDWSMVDHHDALFVSEYPALDARLAAADLIGGIEYKPLGIAHSITKRTSPRGEVERRFLFVVYEARVRVRSVLSGEGLADDPAEPGEQDEFLGLAPIEEAIGILESAPERLQTDLVVLDLLRLSGGSSPTPLASARREATTIHAAMPRGSTRPMLVRLKAWRDRHPWVMVSLWAGSVLLALGSDFRGLFGL